MIAHVNIEASLTPEENARTELCTSEVNGILEKYGCVLWSVAYIGPDGRIGSETHILPKKPSPRIVRPV